MRNRCLLSWQMSARTSCTPQRDFACWLKTDRSAVIRTHGPSNCMEFICTDASSHDARKRGLEVVHVRPLPHCKQVVLAVLLEVGDRELIIEVRVGAEHFIEVVIVLADRGCRPQTSCAWGAASWAPRGMVPAPAPHPSSSLTITLGRNRSACPARPAGRLVETFALLQRPDR